MPQFLLKSTFDTKNDKKVSAEWTGHVTCEMYTKLRLKTTQREHLEN
jgi:hypothetical protein